MRRIGALVLALAATTGAVVAAVASGIAPATVATPAERVGAELGDLAVVYQVGPVDATTIARSEQVAAAVGGVSTIGRTGTLHARGVVRDGSVVHAPPDGYTFPLTFAAYPTDSLGWLLGFEISGAVSPTTHPEGVVLNAGSAALHGAQAGDVIELETRSGALARVVVTAVAPEKVLGGTEVVLTTDLATRLGETRDMRTIIWGFDDRAAFDAAVAATGLDAPRDTKVSRSWDLRNPDSVLDTLDLKRQLGIPWYRVLGGGTGVTMHSQWVATNLTPGRELLSAQIPIRARCNVRILDDLKAALADVAAAGLGWAIEVANANTYGGCYTPRFARDSWNLSRHSYGVALDTNTVSNCQGCVPKMNCDVVRIFRRHNFAWGGNFNRPDGMHFEWVGEPRDQIAFPSRYCPNTATAELRPQGEAVTLGRDVLDAGLEPQP